MGNMKDMANNVRGNLIPQLFVLRRVPVRYRQFLPLTVMKRFQCVVVGSARGVLTVAISDPQNTLGIESLRRITGQAIFPVLIDPKRMRLLIRRIERSELYSRAFYPAAREIMGLECYLYVLQRLQLASIVLLLAHQNTKSPYDGKR
jgi:Type II secretion system (T2SS), protein E, N-terminal domain